MTEETKISEFNELMFKMMRIHTLQHQINELWINPLSPNNTYGDYNYNLILANLDSLYFEVDAKCNEKEREEVEAMFIKLRKQIRDNPVYETRNHPTSRKPTVSDENWDNIRNKLRKLNLFVRRLLDNHGFSPDKASEDDWRGL